ncbi:DNA-3-methyladenine glycosylase [Chryseolinea sp. T2]|uniref:DNA-3-methyladenine glycosylase n=1 Tax=Chryseolinea sp. T2 TaxID=3129255 RepID=UPI0030784C84
MNGQKLPESFYDRTNVVRIARELLGKSLYTQIDGVVTGGMIVETEAYSWKERGCHAYDNRKTARNAVMFGPGGHAYVYMCYGIHYLFNVVTNGVHTADAILVRALEPHTGVEAMESRRGKLANRFHLTSGPGKLTRALGIDRQWNGKSLMDEDVWIADNDVKVPAAKIVATPRIGIDYAGEDALLPWRFYIKGNLWVSAKRS